MRPTSAIPRLLAAALPLAAMAAASAHDFWLEPATFRPMAGAPTGIDLKVGHAGDVTTLPRSARRLVRFVVRDAGGERPVEGSEGATPAGLVRLARPGLAVIGYESNHARSELDPVKFEAYLREVGLERIVDERARRGAAGAIEPELYMRCPKALVVVQPAAAGGPPPSAADGSASAPRPADVAPSPDGASAAPIVDRPLGLRLELIAGPGVASIRPGEALPFTLLYEGRPIADVLVVARDLVKGAEVARARSGADGTLALAFPRAGRWLVTCVHMVKAPAGAGAVWESVWASATLQVE